MPTDHVVQLTAVINIFLYGGILNAPWNDGENDVLAPTKQAGNVMAEPVGAVPAPES